ncbi:hypothetical protein ACWOE5_06860 [Aerococcus sanguinicola]|nr:MULTISPECIES: hypothetical protein [Aerococcus]MDK7050455.1 hypothetical protein [Aerococcus sanguinicola]PKZ21571.1 hypothetical protein CYJ28_06595 [Aerococcus sanguinicola]
MISELWRFCKENLLKIILGAAVLTALLFGLRVLLTDHPEESLSSAADQTVQADEATLEASKEGLKTAYSQEPAEFQFSALVEDGNVFSNSFLIDEYLARPDMVKKAEEKSGVKFADSLQAEQNLGLYKNGDFRGGLAAVRDTSSGVITLRVLLGKTPEENKKIAQAYYDILQEPLPFTRDLNLIMLGRPEIGERLDLSQYEMVATPNTIASIVGSNSLPLWLLLVAAYIVALLIVAFLLFIWRLFDGKIRYAFEYVWAFEDEHLLAKNMDEGVQHFINQPYGKDRLLLAEEGGLNAPLASQQTLEGFSGQMDEIVILLQAGQSHKKWYQAQYRLAKLYHVPIKIVHLIQA